MMGRTAAAGRMLDGLRKAGLKLTPQRLAIVEAFADDPSHPTAQEIFERLRPSMPTMSFATVYSTLDTLASAGLCTVRALSPGPARFDPNVQAHNHVVCDVCGSMRDVEPLARRSSEPRLPLRPASPTALEGFRVRAVETIYRGVCAACTGRTADT